MSFSLRDKQIREVLDYDREISKRAYNLELKWAKQINETYLAPDRQEKAVAFQIDQYFIKLRNALDVVIQEYSSTRQEQPINEIVKQYQLLIAYLNQYIERKPLNQRDISIIEDKFDLLTSSVQNIASIADAEQWKGANAMNTLVDILEYHNYIPLTDSSLSKTPSKRLIVTDPVIMGNPIMRQENVYVPREEMEIQTPAVDNKAIKRFINALTIGKLNDIIDNLPEEQSRPLILKLNEKKTLKDKKDYLREVSKEIEFSEIFMDLIIKERELKMKQQEETGVAWDEFAREQGGPASPPQTAAEFRKLQTQEAKSALREDFVRAKELGASVENWEELANREPAPMNEEREEMVKEEGQGRKKKEKKYGGDNEGILGGLPGGVRTALVSRPNDYKPITIGRPFSEEELTLPMKMQFLNQTDTHRLYDDDEPVINSQNNYKKMKKKLAKQRD